MVKTKKEVPYEGFKPGVTPDIHWEMPPFVNTFYWWIRRETQKRLFRDLLTPHAWLLEKIEGSHRSNRKQSTTFRDTFNMLFSDEELLTMIAAVIWIENMSVKTSKNKKEIIIKQEWLEKINDLMNKALHFYEQELYHTATLAAFPGKTKKFNFSNTQQVVDFISSTSIREDSPSTRQIRCSLIKIAHTINEVEKVFQWYPELLNSVWFFEDLFKNAIAPKFTIVWESWNFKSLRFTANEEWSIEGMEKFRFYTIHNKDNFGEYSQEEVISRTSCRVKTIISMILKCLYNREYRDVTLLKDFFGVRSTVDSPLEALLVIEFIYYTFIKKGEPFKIETKSMITKEVLLKYKDKLTPEFFKIIYERLFWIPEDIMNELKSLLPVEIFEELRNNWVLTKEMLVKLKPYVNDNLYNKLKTTVVKSKSPWSMKKYENITIEFKISYKWKEYPIEWRAVKKWNQNESWYRHPKIYDAVKRVLADAWLKWYVSEAYIKRVIYRKIKNDNEIAKLGEINTPEEGKEKRNTESAKVKREKKIVSNIFNYLIETKKILRIRVVWYRNQDLYVTKQDWNIMNKDGMYPEWVTLVN